MKTILIATDYSRSANNAMEYAAALAKGMEARLVLFNAFNLAIPPTSAPISVPNVQDLLRENNERITHIGLKIAQANNIQVDCVTTTDLILDGLQKQVKKQKADLVVMGMRGSSMLTKLMGSVTTSVIKNGKFPVLVIPEDASFRGVRRILFACNYDYLMKNSKLESIYELAATYKAQVQILHVEKDEQFLPGKDRKPIPKNTPNMEALLRGVKHAYRFMREKNVLEGIDRAVEEYHADILVMVPHKASFWEALLHPSLTRKMTLHTHVPLLVLPNIKKRRATQPKIKPVKIAL